MTNKEAPQGKNEKGEEEEKTPEAFWESMMDDDLPNACFCSNCGHMELYNNMKGECPRCNARMVIYL